MKRVTVFAVAMLLALPLLAIAQPGAPGCNGMHCGGNGPHGGRMGMRGHRGKRGGFERLLALADELKLTDSQRQQLRDMFTEFRLQRIDQQAAVKKAKVRLRSLMMDDQAAERDVMRAIDDVAAARADLQKMQYEHRKQALSVLTEDQRAKLKELRRQRPKMGRRELIEERIIERDDGPRRGRM